MRLRAPQITSRRPPPPRGRRHTTTAASTTETPTVPPPLHVPVGAKDGALAASSSPGVALGTADGVTAPAASATETDPDVDTNPVPAATLTASSFFTDVTVGVAHGTTAAAASAADTGMDVDTDPIPAVIAPTPPNTDTNDSPKRSDAVRAGRDVKLIARSFTPRSKKHKTTGDPENQGGVDARDEDRGGA